ncbi:MAG: hypothetical protein KDB94_05190, partial [Acidobacteria bacterium]|nr:hypothetical protein [Acidobacteriota bacterium]
MTRDRNRKLSDPDHVLVRELLGEELVGLELAVLSGADLLDLRRITHPRVQKPGLAFAGYYEYIKEGRVQIVGESELAYLRTVSAAERRARLRAIAAMPIPVVVVTKGLVPLPDMAKAFETGGVPLLSSKALSSVVIKELSFFLEDHLVPSTRIHGVLLDVYGLGVLIIGGSGVGKSEAALDLITRGHSLVADDRVSIKRYPNGELIGYSE